MVKVASVLGATGLALFIREGIDRPLLPSTAALLRKRAWLGRREVSPGATGPTALGRRVASRENILASECNARDLMRTGLSTDGLTNF
jgi:hypothetical protein